MTMPTTATATSTSPPTTQPTMMPISVHVSSAPPSPDVADRHTACTELLPCDEHDETGACDRTPSPSQSL